MRFVKLLFYWVLEDKTENMVKDIILVIQIC